MAGRISGWLAAFLALGAVGCASDVQSRVAFDPLARFPAQATWRWDERASSLPDDPALLAAVPDLPDVIRAATERELARRGYRAIRSGRPDYWLSYDLATYRFLGVEGQHAIGSLSLTLVDAGSRHPVWAGFLQAELRVGLDAAEREERLARALAGLLEEFPPAQRGE